MEISSELSVLLEIEQFYRILDTLDLADRPFQVKSGSVFEADLRIMTNPTPPYWCNVHLVAARDHMKTLRRITGQRPGGIAEWPSHAAWTLVRVVVEAASYSIWIAAAGTQRERFARAFQMWNRDAIDEIVATELTYSKRKRPKLGLREAHRERLMEKLRLLPWDITPDRIDGGPVAVECIEIAARESRVAQADSAVMLWRVASGYTHARSWAHLTSGDFETLETTATSTLVRGTANVATLRPIIALALGLLEYADWLVAKKSGHPLRLPRSVELRVI